MKPVTFNQIFGAFTEWFTRCYPVTCASDEFYYFPQVTGENQKWDRWDDFSIETVNETVGLLKKWEGELDRLEIHGDDLDAEIDHRLLAKMMRTLREQLTSVRAWQAQPTFLLTIATVGMAEALMQKDDMAAHERAKRLPFFLEAAAANLAGVPRLFRDLALEMIPGTRYYFLSLKKTLPEMKTALAALERFETAVEQVQVKETFRLPPRLLETLFKSHINTGMGLLEIDAELDREIAEMEQTLASTASGISPRLDWKAAIHEIPLPRVGQEGLMGLYRRQVADLIDHCVITGLVPETLAKQCPVAVKPVPGFLAATRTASSYSIEPRHPPTGGTFYVFKADDPEEARQIYQREYRLLAAHETWPGHHLLDICRWSHQRPVRRVVEQPIFYEGWACFSEELMRSTGYFPSVHDRLQLSRRRLWRAMRGKLDLKLQTGAMDIDTAAKYLSGTGIALSRAWSTVRKYALNPGYQLCYTLGVRYFIDIFENFGRDRPQWFAKTVLAQGEIGFDDLKTVLKESL